MFNEYPYLNLNDLNLDYILKEIKEMSNEVTNFVSINAIKYADPIQWNITRQYEKNTIVIDPVTGTAYISVAPVPSGVSLTRPEYWTVVFDLGMFIVRAAKNFTNNYEAETTTTATFSTPAGGWLVWGDVLYKAITNITAGDSYVVNGNIEHFTIEDLYNSYLNTIATILATIGDLQDLTTSDTSSIVNAINSVVTDYMAADTTLDNKIDNAINSVVTDYMAADTTLDNKIGNLNDLHTTDKTSVKNAINEIYDFTQREKSVIKLSELPEITLASVQNAVDRYDVIDFDVDFNLESGTLVIDSNKEIYSSNNSVLSGTATIFKLFGTISDTYDAAITFTDRNEGTFAGVLEDNREYLIVSDVNCVGATAYGNLGYPEYMGGGTDFNQECYPVIYTNVHVSGSTVRTNVSTYARFNTGKAYKYNPVVNVYIHDLNIDASGNTNAYMANYFPIHLKACSSCTFKNIKIIVGYGSCFNIASSHGILVDDCSASALDHNFLAHYHNNVFRLCGCYNVILQSCSGTGSQPFDITYRSADPYVSAYCEILNCTSYANYTCLTTHPGTWNCIIDGLIGYTFGENAADGISIRGSLHVIRNCIVYGRDEVDSYGLGSVEGCLTHNFYNNIVQNFDYGYYLHENGNRPFNDRGTPSVIFVNNFIRGARSFLRINKANDRPNISLYANMRNNSMQGDNSTFNTDRAIITMTGAGTGNVQMATISLSVINKRLDYAINNTGSGTLRRFTIDIVSPYSASLDNSSTGSVNNCALSIKGGVVAAITTNGTAIGGMTEYNP